MKPIEEKVKKIVALLFKKQKKSIYHRNPFQDWQRIMFVLTGAALIVIAAGAYLFFMLDNGMLFSNETADVESIQIIDRNALKHTAEYYTQKEATFNELKSATSTSVDPQW